MDTQCIAPRDSVAPESDRSALLRLRGLRSVSQVMAWVAENPARRRILDVVAQDEYAHDVVVSPGDGERFYVFATS